MSNKMDLIKNHIIPMGKTVRYSDNITIFQKCFPSGMKIALAIEFPKYQKKLELLPSLKELDKMGLKQNFIAHLSGVSPAYVSKLLKNT